MTNRRTTTEIIERMTPVLEAEQKRRERRFSEIQEAITEPLIKRTTELLKEKGIEIPKEFMK
jgi:hypothetical protein